MVNLTARRCAESLAVVVGIVIACLTSACSGGTPTAPSVPREVVMPVPVITPPVRGPEFSESFWNQFVHDAHDHPSQLQPLRRLQSPPMLYLRTVDDAGTPIDAMTLDVVQNAMQSVAATFGGGQFGLAGIERGTSSRAGQHGWVTVTWSATNQGNFCGLAEVGQDGGVIALNYQNPKCTCGPSRMYPRLAKHEFGHAFGYWHTDSLSDVMTGQAVNTCDLSPSARESYHAQIAYQTPIGSMGLLVADGLPAVVRIVD